MDSGDSEPESETANPVIEASPEPELVEQGNPPQVPFPFTWSEGGFLPGGVLPGNEEVLEALLGQVQDPDYREPDTTEEIKRALLSRNQYFLGRCFANDCNKLVDHKSVCKQCNIARYCSQECAVFDLGHRSPHPEFHELNTCGVIADPCYKWHVVEPSTIVWDENADEYFCNNLITFN